jgi:hypothetical protein
MNQRSSEPFTNAAEGRSPAEVRGVDMVERIKIERRLVFGTQNCGRPLLFERLNGLH